MTLGSHISELVRIIYAFGNKRTKSLFRADSKNQLSQLAIHFREGGKRDEAVWARKITGFGHRTQSYVRLRSALKQRLIDDLFHLEFQTGSALRKAMYRNLKLMFAVRTLLLLGARQTAMGIAALAMKRAKTYELTADIIELTRILRTQASLEGKRFWFEKYQGEFERAVKLRAAEERLAYFFERLQVETAVTATKSERALSMTRSMLEESYEIFEEFPTFNIGLNYFRLAAQIYSILDDWTSCMKICERAPKFLAEFPKLVSPAHEGYFAIRRLTSSFSVGNLEKADDAARDCDRLYPAGDNNWFVAKEYEFLLRMHSGATDEAALIHTRVTTHPRFETQLEQVREKWQLYGHYLIFVESESLHYHPSFEKNPLAKLVRDVPVYAKDKVGYNMSLLILQYLILVRTGNLDEIVRRADALSQYLRRHLDDRRSTQLYAFISALVLLERHEFDVPKVQRIGAKHVQQLSMVTGKEPIDEVQVLPFPVMWQIIANWAEQARSQRSATVDRSSSGVLA
jgi:hypothetical protein